MLKSQSQFCIIEYPQLIEAFQWNFRWLSLTQNVFRTIIELTLYQIRISYYSFVIDPVMRICLHTC